MSDLLELSRSVVRIPVSGPAPNNTLVYVRAQFPPHSTPADGGFTPYTVTTDTLYQIAGFDQSRAHEYATNTRISVAGWLNLAHSVGDQQVGFALDEVSGFITADGHIAFSAVVALQGDWFEIRCDFWISAYILTQEPQPDFSRPLIDWSTVMAQTIDSHSRRNLGELLQPLAPVKPRPIDRLPDFGQGRALIP